MNVQARFKIGDRLPLTLEDEYADERSDSAQADSYSIVGASVRGKLHSHNNIPRDDAFRVHFDGKWLAMAVADGAGSRSLSRYGASYLSNRLCTRLLLTARAQYWRVHNLIERNELTEANEIAEAKSLKNIVSKAFHLARTDLERFAFRWGTELEDLHSTLLGVVLNTTTGDIGVGQIGDGLILGLDNKREPMLLAEPPTTNDPAASYFITQNDWEPYFYTREIPVEEVECFSTIFLMTDGVSNDCQYGPPPDILKIWANDMDREIRLVPSLQATAGRLKNYLSTYKAKGSFDDRTLVVMYKNKVEERKT
jgi:hypothetical protein